MGRGQDRLLAPVACAGRLRDPCGTVYIRDHPGESAQYGADQELDQGVFPRVEICLWFDARGTRCLAFAGLTRLAKTWRKTWRLPGHPPCARPVRSRSLRSRWKYTERN